MRDFVITVLVLAVAGVVAGILWSLAAPRPPYVATSDGPLLADPSTQALIAADGWFAVITGVLGLLCGAVGYSVSRAGAARCRWWWAWPRAGWPARTWRW
ncbi:hypothetical protein [Streptosporangium vulgare]|uniref:hypothetical protein n=1 Tax=Streptosporangium vulgare TaxID=46190 RepID=UPI0031DEFF72